MQALCQLDVLGDEVLAQLDDFLADEKPTETVQAYARGLVREIWKGREDLDAKIQAVSEHWATRRMSSIDRNVLRVGLCELLNRSEVPAAVVINEAVEIAKAFGTTDSPAFVNGVLDALRKGNEPAESTASTAASSDSMPREG